MRWLLIPVLAFTLMAGQCTPTTSCPPLKAYSKEFLAETAKEVELIAATSPHVMKMLRDYGVNRDQIRACLKK